MIIGKKVSVCFIAIICFFANQISEAKETLNQPLSEEDSVYYVGQYSARIEPALTRVFTSPASGTLTGLVLNAGERIRKGTVIAELNKDEIDLERTELQVALLKEQLEKEEEIERLLKEREECLFNLSLTKEERLYSKDKEKLFEKRMIDAIDKKIKLAKEELETSQQRKTKDFENKVETFIIKMPFDGLLQYAFVPKGEGEEIYVDNGKDIVSVCDDSAFYFSIVISSPEITNLPPELFKFVAELGTGEKIEGTFSHQKVERSSNPANPETKVFYFKVDRSKSDTMYKMLGARPVGKLYFSGTEDMIRISKIELSALAVAKDASSWQELLEKCRPGYQLVLVGETHIIARKR